MFRIYPKFCRNNGRIAKKSQFIESGLQNRK